MEEFKIVDLLDAMDLPLKNRVSEDGYYAPGRSSTALIPEEPLREGEQYRFHFDMSQCVGCKCCVVACNEQNNNPAGVNWRRVGEIEGGRYPSTKKFHLSMACNHCLDPSCLTGCPTDAYVKWEDGIVEHRAEECIGCEYCTWNCPYGVPQFNPERNIVTKCDMCHNRLKEGMLPACVAACPESAIQIEKVNVKAWRENHSQADAPQLPESDLTISTTRITLPPDIPEDMLKANRHHVELEKPHTALILMTVLTQLAAGGFLTLWLADLLSRGIHFLKPIHNFLAFGVGGMLMVAGLALFAAIFHLGRPLYSYKALRGWKRSWLSREVLLFTLFSNAGAVYAGLRLAIHYHKISVSAEIDSVFGLLVVLLGLGGVWASAKIYMVPARPAWNTIRTPLRFFLTGFILGPLFALAVYSLYVFQYSSVKEVDPFFGGAVQAFLMISALAGLLQLFVLLYRLFYLHADQPQELRDSTFLLIHRRRNHFLTRIGLLVVSCFFIPLIAYHCLSLGHLSRVMLVGLALASFVMALAGEFLGRYLFFVTVVAKNIPGSFFMIQAGGKD